MTRKQGDIAQAKLKMLEIYSRTPLISDAEMGRIVNLDAHTVKKYKDQLRLELNLILERVEKQLEAKIESKEGIWQKLSKTLRI